MDTHSIIMPLPEPEALRRIVHQVLSGGDAVLALEGGAPALLDEVAAELAESRCRVLRVSAQAAGGLSLSGVMAQITGRPDLDAHDDGVLERGFQALTVLDPECDRIVLLVSGAEALQRTALRYLQFTCRAAPVLRLVMAGEQGAPDVLEEDETAFLRTRLAASPMIRVASPSVAALPAAVVAAAAQPVPLPPSKPHLAPSGPAPAGLAPHGQAPAGARLPALFKAMSSLPLSGPAQAVPLRSEPHVALHIALPPANTARRRSRAAWIGLSMAASVAAGVLIGRQGWPAEPAALSQPAPEVVQPPVPVQAAPVAAALQRPRTQPQAAMTDQPAKQGQVAAPAPSALPALPALPAPPALLATPVVRAPPAIPAPSAMPPSDHAAHPPAAAGPPDTPASRPPAPPADAGQAPAAQADAAPSRARPAAPARPAEARFREPSVPAQGAPPIRAARRATEAPEARVPDTRPIEPRERAAAGRREPFRAPPSHAPLVAATPEWPSVPTAPWARTGEGRSVIGTYTTDQNGVRTFRSTQ